MHLAPEIKEHVYACNVINLMKMDRIPVRQEQLRPSQESVAQRHVSLRPKQKSWIFIRRHEYQIIHESNNQSQES